MGANPRVARGPVGIATDGGVDDNGVVDVGAVVAAVGVAVLAIKDCVARGPVGKDGVASDEAVVVVAAAAIGTPPALLPSSTLLTTRAHLDEAPSAVPFVAVAFFEKEDERG